MIARAATFVWLTAVWVALWGEISAANVLGGLVVGVLAVFVVQVRPDGADGRAVRTRLRPLRMLRFAAYFAVKLVQANLILSWEVVTPRNYWINEGIVAVPLRWASGPTLTILANAISLTPGTLVVEARQRPSVLYVHVLLLRDPEQVRAEVLHLEWLLMRAFGVDRPDKEVPEAPLEEMVGR